MKQAGHEWFKTLEKILTIIGLHQCIGGEGTYTNADRTIILGTHVDELVGIAPDEATLDVIQREAEEHIELEIRRRPAKLLGMELLWNEDGTEAIMTQQALIESMTTKHLLGELHPKHSLPLNPNLYQEGEEWLTVPKQYQSITGGLLFIAKTGHLIHVNLPG